MPPLRLSYSTTVRYPILAVILTIAFVFVAQKAAAQAPTAPPPVPTPIAGAATIKGDVGTQGGAIVLGGVEIKLMQGTTEIAKVASEGDGTFRIENIKAGQYSLVASLQGFVSKKVELTITTGETVETSIDLLLGSEEAVTVKPPEAIVPPVGTISGGDAVSSQEVEQITGGGGFTAALKLLASVIEVPGGVAIKGGRPSQASTQIGSNSFVDPSTGLSSVALPDDAIDSVTVMPNPYAVEYGRFSSGLVVIKTRRGGDRWRTRVGNLEPTFRTERKTLFQIDGIGAFSPRAEIGGPIVKDRVFLQQSMQYRYRATDVQSRPQDELRTSHRFASFTRVDANLTDQHSLVVLGGIFPSRADQATLGTFTPPPATVDTTSWVGTGGVTERSVWNDFLFSETTFEFNHYDTDIYPQGPADMQLLPETTLGNFFNRQNRTTGTYQFVHTLSGTSMGRLGLQMFKAGADVLYNDFDGSSESRSVFVRRTDGTLARRLDYVPLTRQEITSTDVALFAQDRVQPTQRFYVEFGLRLDRDAVVDRWNLTPRAGAAFLLNASGSAVIRSGYGLFYERTPSAAGVFEDYESASETRYAADGVTPLGPAILYQHVSAPDLQTPRSATWDVAYDHRFNPKVAIHVGTIDRRGTHELIVEPVTDGANSKLLMHSGGESRYREIELGVHLTGGPGADLNVSYVRSQARADLNAFTTFFDAVMQPIVGENQYAPARADAPNRLLARGRIMPLKDWLVVGVVDWRNGLPWSPVDENLDFVGARNSERFPTYFRLDLGVDHRFTFGKLRPWIGLRVDNALDSFLPADVQANITSPNYRSFYNSEYRQYRVNVRFER